MPNHEFHSVLSFLPFLCLWWSFFTPRTARKVLYAGLYWPSLFHDAYLFCKACKQCKRVGNISHRNEMPQHSLLFCEIFDVWGIDFMGPFSISFDFVYILLVVDYVSKWMKAKATQTD